MRPLGFIHPAAVALSALLIAPSAHGQSTPADASPIRIEDAWAWRAPQGAGGASSAGAPTANAAVYLTLTNRGNGADAVLGAETDAAETVELHETYAMSGMMMMRPVPKIVVAAGSTLVLKPGAYHLMLMGLKRDLNPGDRVQVTLIFERAGRVSVDARVR